MVENFIPETFRLLVMSSSAFNFFVLVFFYERDGGSRRKVLYAFAALLIAIGQLHLCLVAIDGNHFEWPVLASQSGFTFIIAASLGSVKRAASYLIDHCGGCSANKCD